MDSVTDSCFFSGGYSYFCVGSFWLIVGSGLASDSTYLTSAIYLGSSGFLSSGTYNKIIIKKYNSIILSINQCTYNQLHR